MKRLFLNIYKCDNPLIDIHKLIELVNTSQMASDVTIDVREADNISLKLRNCAPGSIELVWRMLNINDVCARNCFSGYLDRTQKENEQPVSTVGVCLYATNINKDMELSDSSGDCSIDTKQVFISLLHCYNLINNINYSVK